MKTGLQNLQNGVKSTVIMLSILMVAAMSTFTSCTDYDHSLNNAEDRLDNVEQNTIPTIDDQIEGIKETITNLENLDDELNELSEKVATLEDEAIKQKDLETLRKNLSDDIETLNDTIKGLRDYVDGDLKDWVNTTYATLQQFADLQDALNKIRTDIGTYMSEITEAYTKAIEEAIDASEKSMKSWVNEILTQGYYDIAAINEMIDSLESTDESLQEQIDAQRDALDKAKEDLTEAYEDAIRKIIEDNNGVITETIATAIQDAVNELNGELNNIKNTIATIQEEIQTIKNRINSIDGQIEGINKSINDLTAADTALNEYIKSLEKLINDNKIADLETKDALKDLINELKLKDVELNQMITNLQNYIDQNFKKGIEEWANTTFATLEQYQAVQNTLAEIRTLIDTNKKEITEAYTKAIEEAIAASEESMKSWVNETLAEGYYDIAEIDAKLSLLETADASLLEQIGAQQQALEDAVEELTEAYQTAINVAIETNNGVIDAKISAAIQDVMNSIDTKLIAINNSIRNIQKEIESIKNNIASIEKQIEDITNLINELDNKLNGLDTSDKAILEQIAAQQQALEQIRTELTNAYEEAIQRAIEENNGVINAEIADAIREALVDVESRLDALNGTIENIEEELATLKENFASRIQSIRYLPEYSDGMVVFSSLESLSNITFIISPSNLAPVIAAAHSDANPVVTAWISRTQSTRAVDMPVALTVTTVEGDESGLLTVGVDISSLAEGYWDSFQSANMFIRIQDGNNDVISEMIPVSFENE